jgi:uracil-DNA glycosylase
VIPRPSLTLSAGLPPPWLPALAPVLASPAFHRLTAFLEAEAAAGKQLLPESADRFRALELTRPEEVRVVLLGQDPYPTPGHAHGLCFSVRPEVQPIPRSLRNVFAELHDDVGFRVPNHGCLEDWARRGVLLLNTVLTVPAGEAAGHRGRGWEAFTDAVIRHLDAQPERIVFLLWGNDAKRKADLVKNPVHRVVACAHPSPLSVRLFKGCRCFSATNRLLTEAGRPAVDWSLADR